MKNNTKLIMETWRRFLKEGLDGIDEELPGEPPFEDEEPLENDEDLENLPVEDDLELDPFERHESPYYDEDPESYDPDSAFGKDEYSDLPPDYESSYDEEYYDEDPDDSEFD